jgi:hypothetical protein
MRKRSENNRLKECDINVRIIKKAILLSCVNFDVLDFNYLSNLILKIL